MQSWAQVTQAYRRGVTDRDLTTRMREALGTVQQGAVRFSFSYFNTENEVDTAIAAVRELAE